MASNHRSVSYDNDVKEVKKQGKNSKNKPTFVPLNGLSQSAKDRRMNNRTVKPPKNLNLVEGDPIEDLKFQRKRQIRSFPSEQLLSSKIKEVNGMDVSNHSIEMHYRNLHSQSVSPEIGEDSTNSSSTISDSVQSGGGQDENSTEIESSNTESGLAADCDESNHEEYKADDFEYDPHFIDTEEIDDFIRGCRYSKNAAIIGLLKNNMISVDDLETNIEEIQCLSIDEDKLKPGNKKKQDNPRQGFVSESNEFANYPHLVPHPEDPDFYTHPLQAFGKVDDGGNDFRLPRLGQKEVVTPRQFFISEGLNDATFQFERKTPEAPKPKLNMKIPKINSTKPLPYVQHDHNTASNDSYIPLTDGEDDEFRLNHNDFPTL